MEKPQDPQQVVFDASAILARNAGNRLTEDLIEVLAFKLNRDAMALVESAMQQGRLALTKELVDAGILMQGPPDGDNPAAAAETIDKPVPPRPRPPMPVEDVTPRSAD